MIFNIITNAIPAIYSVWFTKTGSLEYFLYKNGLSKSLQEYNYNHINLLQMMSNYHLEDYVGGDADYLASQLKELPYFLTIFSPALFMFIKHIISLFKKANKQKIYYYIMLIGPLLIALEFYLFCDYGRYVWWLFYYFSIVELTLMAMDDNVIFLSFEKLISISNVKLIGILLLFMFYQPLCSNEFTYWSYKLANILK